MGVTVGAHRRPLALATAVVLLGIRLGSSTPAPLYVLGLSAIAPIVLGFCGGGFGSQLLPPLAPARRRRSFESP